MAPQLSCAIARIVGSRSANGAVPPPFPAGAAARPAVPVAALMAAQTRREPRWPQWHPAPPPRDDMRAAAKEQNPAGRRRRAGHDEGQGLPYATSAWLGAKRHPEIQSSRTNLNLVYTQVNENTFLIATLRPIGRRDKYAQQTRWGNARVAPSLRYRERQVRLLRPRARVRRTEEADQGSLSPPTRRRTECSVCTRLGPGH